MYTTWLLSFTFPIRINTFTPFLVKSVTKWSNIIDSFCQFHQAGCADYHTAQPHRASSGGAHCHSFSSLHLLLRRTIPKSQPLSTGWVPAFCLTFIQMAPKPHQQSYWYFYLNWNYLGSPWQQFSGAWFSPCPCSRALFQNILDSDFWPFCKQEPLVISPKLWGHWEGYRRGKR